MRSFASPSTRVACCWLLLGLGGCDWLFETAAEPRPADVTPIAPRHETRPFDASPALADPAAAANKLPLELTGRVVRVADGDTLTVEDPSGKSYKVRLVGIDAPELKQPYGDASRAALFKQSRGKTVRVRWREEDQFGRLLGDVYLGEEHLNASQVRGGWAWKYLHARDAALAAAERAAREERLGLWSDANPTPPWEYRRAEQQRTAR